MNTQQHFCDRVLLDITLERGDTEQALRSLKMAMLYEADNTGFQLLEKEWRAKA